MTVRLATGRRSDRDPRLRQAETAALAILRILMEDGCAGIDDQDSDVFVVAASGDAALSAELALDVLRASQLTPRGGMLRATLPGWARAELGVDEPDAPRLYAPTIARGGRS